MTTSTTGHKWSDIDPEDLQRSTKDADACAAILEIHPEAHFGVYGYHNPRTDKWRFKAPRPGWRDYPAEIERIRWNIRHGLAVGILPASIGGTVIDIDHGDYQTFKDKYGHAARPAACLPSRKPGRYHIWYPDDTVRGTQLWKDDELSGEVISGSGLVILWDNAPALLYNALKLRDNGDQYPHGTIPVKQPPQSTKQYPINANRKTRADPERLADALSFIPADSYNEWFRVGRGLTHAAANGELEPQEAEILWHGWSATGAGYERKEAAYNWDYYRSHPLTNNPITLGTVFWMARENGYDPKHSRPNQ